jgi:bifunctional DNase/RNase
MAPAGLTEMVVESVRVNMLNSQHVVILKEVGRERYLPIWIGPWEADAIARRLQDLAPERPLTHDLFAATLQQIGATLRRVVVSEIVDETFKANLEVEIGGRCHEVDARPSDAIALAVRVGATIYASEAVLDRAAVVPESDEEEKLAPFREFVNSLDIDFGSPGEGGGAASPED